MKIYTASPRPFFKNGESLDSFFSRDTGLLCHAFQQAGHESNVVLLDGPGAQAHPDIIRASLEDMESAEWWSRFELDTVVLYAWMLPCYLKIAQAIQASGAKLISRCDSTGLYDPRVDYREYVRQEFYGYGSKILTNNNIERMVRAPLKTINRLVDRRYQRGVVAFADCCDEVWIESTLAQSRMRRFLKLYGRDDLTERVKYVPHSIDVDQTVEIPAEKEKLIVAVGRWDDYIKNGPLLIRVLIKTLKQHSDYRAVIIGPGIERLKKTVEKTEVKGRIEFAGRIAHAEVQRWMAKAQIMLVTSRYESFNMAAAEALCMGASVVGSAHLPSMFDFGCRDFASLAERYGAVALTTAVEREIRCLESGQVKNASACSVWRKRFSAEVVTVELTGSEPGRGIAMR